MGCETYISFIRPSFLFFFLRLNYFFSFYSKQNELEWFCRDISQADRKTVHPETDWILSAFITVSAFWANSLLQTFASSPSFVFCSREILKKKEKNEQISRQRRSCDHLGNKDRQKGIEVFKRLWFFHSVQKVCSTFITEMTRDSLNEI